MAISVKKTISLDFMGDEYKDAYVVLNSISLRDYEKFLEIDEVAQDPKKAYKVLTGLLLDRFIEGKFPIEGELIDLPKEDLLDLPADVVIEIIGQLKGNIAPKENGQ